MGERTKLGWVVLGLVFAVGSWAPQAHAHISLEQGGTHLSRYGDQTIKDGPCGMPGGKRGTHVYTYEPGQTITVSLVEYVAHPSYFRFAFDDDGDDGFHDPVSIKPIDPNRGCPALGLSAAQAQRDQCSKADFYNDASVLPGMDDLDPHLSAASGMKYTFQVKLPDVECDNCTLQVIQVMQDATLHGPYDLMVDTSFLSGDLGDVYHQCIDLVLKRSAAAGSPDAGVGTAGAGAAGTGGMAADTAGVGAADAGGSWPGSAGDGAARVDAGSATSAAGSGETAGAPAGAAAAGGSAQGAAGAPSGVAPRATQPTPRASCSTLGPAARSSTPALLLFTVAALSTLGRRRRARPTPVQHRS